MQLWYVASSTEMKNIRNISDVAHVCKVVIRHIQGLLKPLFKTYSCAQLME